MIIKSSNLMYLFDFDGTLSGIDAWSGWFNSLKTIFKKCHFNPGIMDIRWCILTARPKIDYPLLKLVCYKHKLFPQEIFTSDTVFYHFKNLEEEMNYKNRFIKSILDKKFQPRFCNRPVTKIFYIDNNNEANKLLNNIRGDSNYLAMTVSDLYNQRFTSVIL